MKVIDFKTRKKRPKVLTLKLLKESPNGWEAVLACRLPRRASQKLLVAALHSMFECIHFNAHSILDQTEKRMRKLLQPAFDKIVEIALLRKTASLLPSPDEPPEGCTTNDRRRRSSSPGGRPRRKRRKRITVKNRRFP